MELVVLRLDHRRQSCLGLVVAAGNRHIVVVEVVLVDSLVLSLLLSVKLFMIASCALTDTVGTAVVEGSCHTAVVEVVVVGNPDGRCGSLVLGRRTSLLRCVEYQMDVRV